MKKIYIVFLIAILFIVSLIFYIQKNKTNEPKKIISENKNILISNLIGTNHSNYSKSVQGFNIIKTRTMDIGGEGNGLVSYAEKGELKVLLFELFDGQNERNEPLLKIIDAILLPNIKEDEALAFYCGDKLENDDHLIQDVRLVALVKNDNQSIWTQVEDVWMANLETNKIDKIPNQGIKCHNESLSPYYP